MDEKKIIIIIKDGLIQDVLFPENSEYALEVRDYDIDGLVFKPNGKVTSDDWKYPKHQIAWKFPHQSAETILKDVIDKLLL